MRLTPILKRRYKPSIVFLVFLLLFSAFSTAVFANHLVGLRICDREQGTALVRDRVALCNSAAAAGALEGELDFPQIIPSVDSLQRTNQRPLTIESITFLYEEPAGEEPKQVRAILTADITPDAVEFLLGAFSLNLVSEHKLMIVLDNEYYLLTYPEDEELFDTELLQLTHLPTRQTFPIDNFEGTDWFIFSVLGQRRIALGAFGDDFVIQSLLPGESPAAYVIPWNLTQRYEVPFSFNQPVNITDPVLGVFTICQSDNSRDAEQVQVCRNDELAFTLQAGRLTKLSLEGKEYAFRFEVVDGLKQVSLFSLVQLGEHEEVDPYPLNYNDFINNLVEGRRIALEFPAEASLYLLQHPAADFLSLPDLQITAYDGDTVSSFPASGSQGQVEFPAIGGGKIFLRRNYGDPPPPFDLWALEQQELTPINLDQQLFTSFSSLGSLIFVQPNLGTLSVRAEDISFSSLLFKVHASQDSKNIDLPFRVPQEEGEALFYYHTAAVSQGIPVKTASIYRLYALVPDDAAQAPFHLYDDAFINVFTRGNELALRFGNSSSYYLLGHDTAQNTPAFFELARTRLRTLDRGTTFLPQLEAADRVSFAVPEGSISIEADDRTNQLRFLASTQAALSTVDFEGYMAELSPMNRVRIPGVDGAGGTILRLCFVNAYASLPSARVCSEDNSRTIDEVVAPTSLISIRGTSYLLESNQQTGSNKRVFIRQIISLLPGREHLISDWVAFASDIAASRKPVFRVDNRFYFPYAQDSRLQTFGFGPYPAGTARYPQNLAENTPLTFNGSIVLHDRVLFLSQQETDEESRPVEATLRVRNYFYLPENQEAIGFNATSASTANIPFVLSVDGTEYRLGTGPVSGQLIRLALEAVGEAGRLLLLDRLFAEGEMRVLRLSDTGVEIHVESIVNGEAHITIRRR